MAALTRALTIDPYFLPALLARAAWFERGGKLRQAAKIYKDVLTIVPPDARVEPWLAERHWQQARRSVEEQPHRPGGASGSPAWSAIRASARQCSRLELNAL